MLKITPRQMGALATARQSAFLERMAQFAKDRLGVDPETATLAGLFERGAGYGLVSEQDYAAYLTIALAAEVKPPAPDPDWIAGCMSDAARPPQDRLERLFALAKAQARGGGTRR